MQKPMFEKPRQGQAIYLLIRNGKLALYSGFCTVKIFTGPEHLEWYRRRYPTQILPTDKLVKYVPAPEEDQPKLEDKENDR